MIKRIWRRLCRFVLERRNPVKYAKKIGVNGFVDGKIYGQINWGTEPWLITIGKNCHITKGVSFITHDGGTLLFRDKIPDLEVTKPIVLGDNVYVGINTLILPGVTVGSNCIIGAGSIVTRDVPDNSVVAGVPARVVKSIDDYFEKIQKESLHLGHLKGEEKDKALMRYYNYTGKSKGIYF